jgi:hypothetical protein
MIAFAPERIRAMRQRPTAVYLALVRTSEEFPSDVIERQPLRGLFRESVLRDDDGNVLGVTRERVNDVDEDGELRPAVITVLSVERNVEVAEIAQTTAIACGYKTTDELQNAWFGRHPRSPTCHLVTFALGDVRDKPRFLTSTSVMRWGPGKKGGSPLGDYTTNPRQAADDAEALTDEQYATMAAHNRQKDAARSARTAEELAKDRYSVRLARILAMAERIGTEAEQAIRPNVRKIAQRVSRAENRREG